MSTTKFTELGLKTESLIAADKLPIIDINDTASMGPGGSNKIVTAALLADSLAGLMTDGVLQAVKIANSGITPVKLSSGAPTWSNAGNLDIATNSASNEIIVTIGKDRTNSGSSSLDFYTSGTATATASLKKASGDSGILSLSNSATLSFFTGSPLLERLTILADGKVGIGTNNPSSALHVNGTITATSYSGSAALSGTPTAPTAGSTTNTTQIATTAFVQSVIAVKQGVITGAATTIASSDLTTNRALIANSDGKVAVSDITSTELGYLDGVTSNIQTQLNAKAPLASPSFSGTVKSSLSTTNSLTAGAIHLDAASGAMLFDNGGHKRITWNDSSGNFSIRSGAYHNGTNLVYAKASADSNGGAAGIVFDSDALDGAVKMEVAAIGVPGATVTVANSLVLNKDLVYTSKNFSVGDTQSRSGFGYGGQTPNLQVHGTAGTRLGIARWTDDNNPAIMHIAKSRGAAVGTRKIVANDDTLGVINFEGDNGTAFKDAARIVVQVDGVPGTGDDMPGRIVFSTSADGSASPSERMRIDSAGNVGIGKTAASTNRLDVSGNIAASSISASNITGTHFRASQGAPNSIDASTVGYAFGADGDSGLFSPIISGSGGGANGTVSIYSNNSERLRATSTGVELYGTVKTGGSIEVGAATGDANIEIGKGATANRYAYTDYIGDTKWNDYGLRVIRGNTGENANSEILHRGTGTLMLNAQHAGNIVFATSDLERARIDSSGTLILGANTAAAGRRLEVRGSATGTTDAIHVVSGATIGNDVTNSFTSYSSYPTIAAGSSTLTLLRHYVIGQGAFGAGSTVTNQFGFVAGGDMIGATWNHGFYGDIDNSSASISNVARTNDTVTLTTSTAHGFTVNQRISVSCSNSAVNGSYTIASVPTTTTLTYSQTGTNIASAAATGSIDSNGRWNFYADGSAPNYFRGRVGIGTGSNVPSSLLHVFGGVLGDTVNNTVEIARFSSTNANSSHLRILSRRHTTGTDWFSASSRIQHTTDSTDQGFIDFNPKDSNAGIAIGSGTTTAISVTSSGNVGLGISSSINEKLSVSGDTRLNGDVLLGTRSNPTDFWTGSGNIHTSLGTFGSQGGYSIDITANGYRDNTAGVGLWKTLDVNGSKGASQIRAFNTGNITFHTEATKETGVTAAITERMRIDSSGNVGIGTTTPAAKLTVLDDSTNDALRVTQTGAGNAFVVADATGTDTTPFVIDAEGRMINGHTSALSLINYASNSYTPTNQFLGTLGSGTTTNAALAVGVWSANADAPQISFAKSRGTAIGTHGLVQSGDTVFAIHGAASDGAAYRNVASITANIDGAASAGDMPGRLVFSTTADGASSPTERLRIDSSGNVGIGTGSSAPAARLEVKGGTSNDANPEFRITGSSGHIDFHNSSTAGSYAGITSAGDKAIIFSDGTIDTGNLVIAPWATGTKGIRITKDGNVGIGKNAPTTALDVAGTITATSFVGSPNGNVTSSSNSGVITLYGGTSGNGAHIELYGGSHASNANLAVFDANEMRFRDSAGTSERIRITSAGYVGIGAPQPSAHLDIQNGTAEARIRIGPSTAAGYIFGNASHHGFYSASGGQIFVNRSSPFVDIMGTIVTSSNAAGGNTPLIVRNDNAGNNTTKTAGLLFQGVDTVSTIKSTAMIQCGPAESNYIGSYLAFQTRSADTLSERMRITNSGVEVSGRIEVKGGASNDANPELRISGSSGYIDFHNSAAVANYSGIVSAGDKTIIFSNGMQDTGNLVIAPWSTGNKGIKITYAGNVGIGTSDPASPLTVIASTDSNNPSINGIRVVNTGTAADDNAYLAVHTNGANGGDPVVSWDINGVAGWSAGIDNSDEDKFKIAANWNDLASNNAITIDRSGNVGLGTTNPKQRLQVEGNVAIRSNAPTIGLIDTTSGQYEGDNSHQNAYIHVNNGGFHILTGNTADDGTQAWAAVANNRWPLYINLTNNNAQFGGDVNAISFTAANFYGNSTSSTTAGSISSGSLVTNGNQINPGSSGELALTYQNANGTTNDFYNTTIFNGKRAVSAKFWGDTKTFESYGPCRSITNGQNHWSNAGLESRSATGNALVCLHAAGNTAALIKHVRGGSGLEIRNADDTDFAPLTASSFNGTATKASTLAQGGGTGAAMTFNWVEGNTVTPAWLWGGWNGTDMYVYNPLKLNVAYADRADNVYRADQLQAYTSDDYNANNGHHYIKAIRDPNGWGTRLKTSYYRGGSTTNDVHVGYADSASITTTALGDRGIPGGTSSYTYTGIPDWAKKITILFHNVSIANSSQLITVRVHTASGQYTNGYVSTARSEGVGAWDNNSCWVIAYNNSDFKMYGRMTLSRFNSATWIQDHTLSLDPNKVSYGAGTVNNLNGPITAITIASGRDSQFDSGAFSVLVE